MKDHQILGVHVSNRSERATDVQRILSEHGHLVKTRIGLHDVEGNECSPGGLILLELHGERAACDALHAKLSQLAGVDVQSMVFKH